MFQFATYDEAYAYAQAKADSLKNYDYGLEKMNGGFHAFMLPSPSKRFGFETRCQVVRPTCPGPRYRWP